MSTLVETVPFVYIQNPLAPADNRLTLLHAHEPNKPLSEYLGPLEGEWAVSVSGRVIESSDLSQTYIGKNDCVVVCPLVYGGGGGGGGKMILKLVAMIALTIFTAGAGLVAMGAMMGVTSATGLAVLGAVVQVGGAMAINALLPPPKPKTPKSGSDFNSSPSYGIDGPKNVSSSGIPVPVAYGESWFAGNFIQSYVDNVGEDQYLNLLMNLGEGPIEGVSDIQLNSQPITNFTNVEFAVRTGIEDQTLIPYFDDIVVPVNRSVNLDQAVNTLHSVVNPVDRLRLDFTLPVGISYLDDEDGMQSYTVSFKAEIRETGTSTWLPFTGSSANISITARQMSAVRRSYYSAVLDREKRYELRLTHNQATDAENISNKVALSDVNEITFDNIKYKHTALLGIRIKLGDQLNGIPSVKFKLKGRKVPIYDASTGNYVNTWTDNPAWISLDVMMNKRYGGGIASNRIKMDYFRQWAEHCTQNDLRFNGVIDQRTNLWDALAPICKVGRAQIVRAGTRFQVSMVRKAKPVQMFSMGSIKKGSLSIDWLPADERANEVHVSYFDKNDQGRQKTVIIASEEARQRGEEARPTEMTLYGVDNVNQATREGLLAMNMQRLLQTTSLEVPLDAIVCTLGDVIAIQHDMPNWGQGGLTGFGSTQTSLVLDKPVSMEEGGDFVVKVRHDSVVQYTGVIDSVVGNIVFPGFGFNVTSFERFRLLINTGTGVDYTVEEPIIDQFGRHGVRVSNPAGLSAGAVIQLVDTNVVETRPVAAFTGERSTITPTSPFSVVPRPETPWAFGLTESVTQMITVMSITGKDDMWKTISGLEYKDEAYDDTVIDYKPAPVNTKPNIGNVTFNGFVERRYLAGAAYTSEVEFTWHHNSPAYHYAEVHVSIDGEPWRYLGDNASVYAVKLSAGELRVKLVPVTIEGFKLAFGSVTEQIKVVLPGTPAQPADPEDIRFEARKTTIEIKWGNIDAWAANKNIYRYEIWMAPGQNASLADAVLLASTNNDHYPHVGLASGTFYTYWVRAVNILANNMKSNFVPTAGLSISTLPADTISDLFPGGIALTDLDDFLQGEIVDNSGIEESIGVLEADIDDTVNELSRIVSDMASKLESVTDGNKTEVFKRIESVGNLSALVQQEIATLVTADEAMAAQLTIVQATISDEILASIEEERIARVTADEATAVQIDTLTVQMGDGVAAAVSSEATARATADTAIAATVTALTAKTTTDIAAAVNAEAIARASGDTAIAATVTALTANTAANIAAAVNTEAVARAAGDTAISATVTALTAKSNANEAAITSEAVARANADTAISSSVTALSSTVGANTTSITQQVSTTDGLKAQYTVKIDSNGNVAGFGLASAPTLSGGSTSEFSIVADRFKVVKPGTSAGIPVFVVDATLNRVVIANAIVGDLQSDNYVAGVSGWKIKK